MFRSTNGRVFSRRKRFFVLRRVMRPLFLCACLGGASLAAGTFVPLSDEQSETQIVSRAEHTEIVLPKPIARLDGSSASDQLRAPVRVIDPQAKTQDLSGLVARALSDLGHKSQAENKLHGLLVSTLAEGQNDRYIDAVLNSALQRGEFEVPDAFLKPSGAFDTTRVLEQIVRLSGA